MSVQLFAAATDRRVYRAAMRTNGQVIDRPAKEESCMMVYCEINGLKAKALLDTGSTINCISPDFVHIAKVPVASLSQPIGLQLGCVGSRSRINFGARTSVVLDNAEFPTYLDVVNLDHYDVILGVPFMRASGMSLDFAANAIRFGTHLVPVLKGEERPVERKTGARAPSPGCVYQGALTR
ncbi:hypothetical protein EIP86_003167 [Pleurotus ostreatoroseus]|nr:hypothetical protein EIP86_003167 [Pleurotus ostreatoroseus]